MLVLSRKPGEAIVLGENIRITVVSVHGNQVRLGIAAPKEVAVRRQELEEPTALFAFTSRPSFKQLTARRRERATQSPRPPAG